MLVLSLRLVKVLAVAALFAGTIGAFLPRELADRRRFALWLAAPGLGVTWVAGFSLAAALDVSLLEGWILGALGLSIVAINVVLFAVAKEGRRSAGAAAVAIGTLVVAAGLMVFRP